MSIILPVVFMIAMAAIFGLTNMASSKDRPDGAQGIGCAGCHMAGSCTKRCAEKED